jgi:hypothetical protein
MNWGHYHIAAADIEGSSKFLESGNDHTYKTILSKFHDLISEIHESIKSQYPIMAAKEMAGIYPIGGDSFWLFIPAVEKDKPVSDSFAFTIKTLKSLKREFKSIFMPHELDIRIGVHTTLTEDFKAEDMGWGKLTIGIEEGACDPVYRMPVFNRTYCREFVVAKRLETTAGYYPSKLLFSDRFVYRMTDYGRGSIDDYARHSVKDKVFTEPCMDGLLRKLTQCGVTEFFEMKV